MLHPLSTVTAEQSIDTIRWTTLYPAQQRLEGLLSQQIVPLKVCSQSGWNLHKILTDVLAKKPASIIDPIEAYYISDALRKFEAVLNAELAQMDTYYVSQKGCYATNHLIEQAEIIFPASIQSLMTAEAIIDARQGGRCLAFELPTAAAFHFLRATESVLHKYYDVISHGKPRPRNRNMGKYIEALEKVPNINDKVLSVLRQIKNLHRNPIMHPEATLDMDEALTLLGIVQSAITTMVGFVKKVQLAAPPAALPSPPPPVPVVATLPPVT